MERETPVLADIIVLCFCVAAAWGKGVYFARDFARSAANIYSPADGLNQKYVFQCRVLTGYFHIGSSDLVEPPVRDEQTLSLYNSVVDSTVAPSIFVVFHDTQVYPEYLIVFQGCKCMKLW